MVRKRIIGLLVMVAVIMLFFCFEVHLQKIIPGYSNLLLLSGFVLFVGLAYAFVMRSCIIGFLTIAIALILPKIKALFVLHWPVFVEFFNVKWGR